MRGSVIKNNFTSGEITPLMYGRGELDQYQKGLAECLNMRVMRHGGATRREGTRFVTEVKDSTKTVRLIPFVFSENDALILEVGDTYIRFVDESGYVVNTTEEITNGTFDTDIVGWTAVTVPVGSLSWAAAKQSMLHYVNNGSCKSRQTITGLTTGIDYTFKFDNETVFSSGSATKVVRLGSTVGTSGFLLASLTEGVNSFTVSFTTTTVYLEFELTDTIEEAFYIDNVSLKQATAFEVTTPYLEAELFELMYAQSNDVMWITHRNHPPKALTRTSSTTFTFADAVIKQGPFAPLNPSAIKMALTIGSDWLVGGTGTCTATSSYFQSTDVGEYFIVYDDSDLTVFAIFKITGFTSTTIMSTEWTIDVPAGLQTGNNITWAIQAIGDRNGYPAAVSFHDQRLIYAGTTTQPQNIFGSTVADFESFTVGTDDDDHYNYQLASTRYNTIEWLAVKHDLIIGTIANEWSMRGGGLEDPITPSNVVTRQYTSDGSIRVMPEEVDDILAFVQRAGHKIIGLNYEQDTKIIRTTDLILMAEHLTSTTQVKQLSYQNERESIMWAVTGAGALIGMTYDSAQSILAWHQHTTGATGLFESITSVPISDSDQTWVLVNRLVNGSRVRYIEYMETKDWRVDNDPYHVDSGITYSGASTTSITGLDHLEGETVEAYSSGEYLGEFTVSSGAITLASVATHCHVGLGFTSRITELPEATDTQDGSGHTRQKRKPKVDVRLYRTQAIRVNDDIRELPRDASAVKPELFSGIIESSNLGWDTDAQNTIESIGANPLTVLVIRSTINVGNE